jgi:hypothetical protein
VTRTPRSASPRTGARPLDPPPCHDRGLLDRGGSDDDGGAEEEGCGAGLSPPPGSKYRLLARGEVNMPAFVAVMSQISAAWENEVCVVPLSKARLQQLKAHAMAGLAAAAAEELAVAAGGAFLSTDDVVTIVLLLPGVFLGRNSYTSTCVQTDCALIIDRTMYDMRR